MNYAKCISKNIKILMKRKNIKTVAELARQIDCSVTTIHNILREDNKSPTITIVSKIATFFNISIDQLIDENNLLEHTPPVRYIPVIKVSEIKTYTEGNLSKENINQFSIVDKGLSKKSFGILTTQKIDEYPMNTLLIFDQLPLEEIVFPNLMVFSNQNEEIIILKVYLVDGDFFVKSNRLLSKNKLIPIENILGTQTINNYGSLVAVTYNYQNQ